MPMQSPHKVGWARFCAHETHAAEGNKKNRPTQLRARRFGVTYGGVLPFAGVGFVGLPDSRHSNVHRCGGHRNVPTLPGFFTKAVATIFLNLGVQD